MNELVQACLNDGLSGVLTNGNLVTVTGEAEEEGFFYCRAHDECYKMGNGRLIGAVYMPAYLTLGRRLLYKHETAVVVDRGCNWVTMAVGEHQEPEVEVTIRFTDPTLGGAIYDFKLLLPFDFSSTSFVVEEHNINKFPFLREGDRLKYRNTKDAMQVMKISGNVVEVEGKDGVRTSFKMTDDTSWFGGMEVSTDDIVVRKRDGEHIRINGIIPGVFPILLTAAGELEYNGWMNLYGPKIHEVVHSKQLGQTVYGTIRCPKMKEHTAVAQVVSRSCIVDDFGYAAKDVNGLWFVYEQPPSWCHGCWVGTPYLHDADYNKELNLMFPDVEPEHSLRWNPRGPKPWVLDMSDRVEALVKSKDNKWFQMPDMSRLRSELEDELGLHLRGYDWRYGPIVRPELRKKKPVSSKAEPKASESMIKEGDIGRCVRLRCGNLGRITKIIDSKVLVRAGSIGRVVACYQYSGKNYCTREQGDHPHDIVLVLPRSNYTVDWNTINDQFNFIAKDGFGSWHVYETMPYLSGKNWKSEKNGVDIGTGKGQIRPDILDIPFRDSLFSRADWLYEVRWAAIDEVYGDWQYLLKDASGDWYLYGFRPKRKPGDKIPRQYDRECKVRIDLTPFAICFDPSAVDYRVSLIRRQGIAATAE